MSHIKYTQCCHQQDCEEDKQMPRIVSVSDADLDWLRSNHDAHSYSDMAQRIGCCVDTLKRILVREGLQEFNG
jgi:hypothetical protein